MKNKILALYKTWKLPLCQAVLKDRTKTYKGFNDLKILKLVGHFQKFKFFENVVGDIRKNYLGIFF